MTGLESRFEMPFDSLIPVSNSEGSIGNENVVKSFDNCCTYRWLDFGQASLNSFMSPFTNGYDLKAFTDYNGVSRMTATLSKYFYSRRLNKDFTPEDARVIHESSYPSINFLRPLLFWIRFMMSSSCCLMLRISCS